MQRNIIVQEINIKLNEERFNLSIKGKLVKSPNTKNTISDSCRIRF
jgi:hypothetical protein